MRFEIFNRQAFIGLQKEDQSTVCDMIGHPKTDSPRKYANMAAEEGRREIALQTSIAFIVGGGREGGGLTPCI